MRVPTSFTGRATDAETGSALSVGDQRSRRVTGGPRSLRAGNPRRAVSPRVVDPRRNSSALARPLKPSFRMEDVMKPLRNLVVALLLTVWIGPVARAAAPSAAPPALET